jgi:hypothetical protein
VGEEPDDLVKVVFELPEPDMGMSGERLWAAPVGGNLYELQNSPWHVRSVNWLDVVEAVAANDDEWPKFIRVHKRSGHRTVHITINDAGEARKQEILDNCRRLGCTDEGRDGTTYALDFAPGVDVIPALDYLDAMEKKELLHWRINDCD